MAVDETNSKLYIVINDSEGDITLPESECGFVYEAGLHTVTAVCK